MKLTNIGPQGIKCFSVTSGITKIEFSVWKVSQGYEARINDKVVYKSESYSACSDAISEDLELDTNVFTVSGAVH